MRRSTRRYRRSSCVGVGLALVLGGVASAREPQTTPTPGMHQPDDATVRHAFDDVPHWQAVLDDPARDAWQKPAALVQALGIRPGMTVADLGAGTGYFSRYLSAAVGDKGTVLAVDPEVKLVRHLRDRAEKDGTANVVPILASLDNPRLPAGAVDLVLIVNTVHHIDARTDYFRRLQRALQPGGRVAIVDYKKEPLPVGPPPAHKLAPEQVTAELTAAGYRLVEHPDVLPYQYVLVFAPEGAAGPSQRGP